MDELLSILHKANNTFSPVVRFDYMNEKIIQLDLSIDNLLLTPDLFADTNLFSEYIQSTLAARNARFGIGGYNEHRNIYGRSTLFDAGGDEPRRLHLGTDIWGIALETIMAPLPAIIHSFNNNNQSGDYGGTIILAHELEGITFFTLYGHLSLRSIAGIKMGDPLEQGQAFAEFGIPGENGQWPPHLHFQLIRDLQGRKGDYPGVCKYSERETWLENSPDPDIILQMNRYLMKD